MKILLINPSNENIVHWYPKSPWLNINKFGAFPPLGLLYILSYLKSRSPKHELFFIDCVAENISYQTLKEKIKAINPDLTAVTSFTFTLPDVFKTVNLVKEAAPDSHINLGGHHAVFFPVEAANIPNVDSIIVGEGEIAFYKLAQALAENKPIENIEGVYTKRTAQKNVPVNYIEDVNTLPFPAREFVAHLKFYNIVGQSDKLTTIITSRGCPFACVYCATPYKKYRPREIENILDEIELCLKQGYEEFHFYDDTFNITPQRIIEFSRGVLKRNLKFKWDFRGRINGITAKALETAKAAGLTMISFGVETGTDEGLKYINKGISVKQIEEVFKLCRKHKIKTVANFMIGFPFEKTEDDINKNINFCTSLNPAYGMFSVLILYPGTPVYNMAVEKKLINPQRWHDFVTNPSPDFYLDYWEEFFTRKQLLDFQKKAFRNFYLRPAYIWRQIKSLTSFEEFKRKVKGFFTLITK